jgi:hypothetical protein
MCVLLSVHHRPMPLIAWKNIHLAKVSSRKNLFRNIFLCHCDQCLFFCCCWMLFFLLSFCFILMVIHFLFYVAIMFADVVAIHINSIFSIMYSILYIYTCIEEGWKLRKIDKKRSENTKNVTCYACTVTLTRSLMTILQSRDDDRRRCQNFSGLMGELLREKLTLHSGKVDFFPSVSVPNEKSSIFLSFQ